MTRLFRQNRLIGKEKRNDSRFKKKQKGRSENKVIKQREKTEQGIERRVQKNRRMDKIESRK